MYQVKPGLHCQVSVTKVVVLGSLTWPEQARRSLERAQSAGDSPGKLEQEALWQTAQRRVPLLPADVTGLRVPLRIFLCQLQDCDKCQRRCARALAHAPAQVQDGFPSSRLLARSAR